MAAYPSNYPCPTWDYGQDMNTHHDRTPMECGWVRQREKWPVTGVAVSLTFEMSTDEYPAWCQWMLDNGYVWFTIDLDDYTGVPANISMRLLGQLTTTYGNFDRIFVTVDGEFEDGDT